MKNKLALITPGTILYEEFMEPLKISAYKLSKELKVQQTAVSQIIKGHRRISVDMALRLSQYFGNSAQFWLNLQNHYDIELAAVDKKQLIREIIPYQSIKQSALSYASV